MFVSTKNSTTNNLGNQWSYANNKRNNKSDQENQLTGKQKFDSRKDCQCKILLLDHTHISIVIPV